MQETTTKGRILPDGRMDPDAASEYCGVSASTLAKKRIDGTGPAFMRVGNRIFYRREAIDAWIAAGGEHTSTAQEQATRTPATVAKPRSAVTPKKLPPKPATAKKAPAKSVPPKKATRRPNLASV